MVRTKRRKPMLAEKLRHIRASLGISQNELIGRMGLAGQVLREEISDFERNKRIPPLEVILQYARAANVTVEALIDDDLDLPKKLPSSVKHEGIKRKAGMKKTAP
jgi:transcriptional regulator with XRE-family HTH domain